MTQGLELRGAVLGKGYRLGRRLDTDDTSAYEATHERIPGRFIIRVFPPETLSQPESSSRIQRGARVASLLRDPHALQVLDCNASGEMPAFVVLERVPGRSLAEVMADDGMLPLQRVVDLVESLAAALTAGHQIGLVHGDLRPAHVILPTSGQPAAKLSGFGWAKELRAAARIPSPSGYLAPEQQFGKVLTLDERTDQFGLAALAYDMIAACLPFSEESADLAGVLGGHRVPPAIAELVPGVPKELDEVLRRALTPTPAERFNTMADFVARVRGAVTGVESSAPQRQPANETHQPGPEDDETVSGATPSHPSSDVTEELDLAALSLLSGDDDLDSDDDEITGQHTRGERIGRSSHGDEPRRLDPDRDRMSVGGEVDVDDIKLVLGGTSSEAPISDEAKTQIVRSPFFEEPEPTEPEASSVEADGPALAPRRGIPAGRPTGGSLPTGTPGGTPVVVPLSGPGGRTRRSAPLQRTLLGIGPETPPTAATSAVRLAALLKGRGRIVGTVAGVGLAAIAALIVSSSRSSDNQPNPSQATSAASAAPQVQPPAPPSPAPTGGTPSAPIVAPVQPLPNDAAKAAPAIPAASAAAADGVPPVPLAAGHRTLPARPVAAPPLPARRPQADHPSAPLAPPAPPVVRRPNTTAPTSALAPNECAIRITSRPWAEVWIDGKNTGRKNPLDTFKVACGSRKLELKRPDQDIEQMEILEVVPGKLTRGSYELE